MEDKLEKTINRLKNLDQNKTLNPEELKQLAIEEIENKERLKSVKEDLDIEDMFIDTDETKIAKKLLKKYINTYTIETISEQNTLKQLVFLEVFNIRIQTELNNYHKEEQPSPPKLVESLHSNLNQISALKDKLGISKDKQKQTQGEGYAVLDTLFKKWKKWRDENQGSRTLTCPHCGKMVLLKIRTDIWETQKHPFFKDRILANPHLMELYKSGKITKRDVAEVLGTSVDYISWLISKVYYREFEGIDKPEIREDNITQPLISDIIKVEPIVDNSNVPESGKE
jgi:DNA-directed RNA polymerase subunit RPC12/RpoP